MGNAFVQGIRSHVAAEIEQAEQARARGDAAREFWHLENAHVLGQRSTALHVKAHCLMFAWGWRHRDVKECVGQLLRIVAAATKTVFGFVPTGNTGGANVSPFKPMPIRPELLQRIAQARTGA